MSTINTDLNYIMPHTQAIKIPTFCCFAEATHEFDKCFQNKDLTFRKKINKPYGIIYKSKLNSIFTMF